jgi:hypothetical protein
MEKSKWPKRLSKQGYTPDSSQWSKLRFLSLEQIMEDEDRTEESIRHISSKQAIRANERDRTQLGKLRKADRYSKD